MEKHEADEILKGIELELKYHMNGVEQHSMSYQGEYNECIINMHVVTPIKKGKFKSAYKVFLARKEHVLIYQGRDPYEMLEKIQESNNK